MQSSYTRLPNLFFQEQNPEPVSKPELLLFNTSLASELGLDLDPNDRETLAQYFSGARRFENSTPLALAYSGHQFGHFNPRLGDGRAHLIGEWKGFDLQLKGSGRTAYSRRGDGKSALGPVIREYIVSEAMHALGIHTTRSLAAVSTGEIVYREEPRAGGILTRVARSHLRIGSFEFAKIQKDETSVKVLADYAIARLYPELLSETGIEAENERALLFFRKVSENYLSLVANWMGVGFIHGVMNTDNASISGETLDFGPCAFMDTFSFNRFFSSIDENGRYRYGNQMKIALWNLSSLAHCLATLIHPDPKAVEKVLAEEFKNLENFAQKNWCEVMGRKLGLIEITSQDTPLIQEWLKILEENELDFTHAHLFLSDEISPRKPSANDFLTHPAFVPFSELKDKNSNFTTFLATWRSRIAGQDLNLTHELMSKSNPVYIPRNHLVEKAIGAAYEGKLEFARELIEVLKNPFQKQKGREELFLAPGPEQHQYQTFCGT